MMLEDARTFRSGTKDKTEPSARVDLIPVGPILPAKPIGTCRQKQFAAPAPMHIQQADLHPVPVKKAKEIVPDFRAAAT